MLVTKEPPFIEIEIISESDPSLEARDILNMIREQNIKTGEGTPVWRGSPDYPILRMEYPSLKDLEEIYQKEYELFDKVLELHRHVDLTQFIPKFDPPTTQELYLILKYRTNYKEPLRKNYEYSRWFADTFQVLVYHEELEDGFLNFYKRKEDFLDNRLDKTNPTLLQEWLDRKGIVFPEEISRKIFRALTNGSEEKKFREKLD